MKPFAQSENQTIDLLLFSMCMNNKLLGLNWYIIL